MFGADVVCEADLVGVGTAIAILQVRDGLRVRYIAFFPVSPTFSAIIASNRFIMSAMLSIISAFIFLPSS
jgi:hypothetical protein